MVSVAPRDMDVRLWPHDRENLRHVGDSGDFVAALLAGGDGRVAVDPHTGLNKYLCPAIPAPDIICASSCTASPISDRGFVTAAKAFSDIIQAPSPRQRARQLITLTTKIEARLLQYFGVEGLAQAILCASGTDALLTTAMLIVAERPNETMTVILPAASETGTGVPLAAVCRVFDGPDCGKPLSDCKSNAVEIPLRSADGSPLGEDEVNDAFAAATAAARGSAIVYHTYGTKTGLIAPVLPPHGSNVIVDACQSRIEPKVVEAYLRRGWPVVVTGSKFFGGPAFSGAVLFPRARLSAIGWRRPTSGLRDAAELGTALRWTAAVAVIDAFEPLAASLADVLADRAATIAQAFACNPALVPVGGLPPRGPGWADRPSIFTFGVRDPTDRGRLLSVAELRPLYARLARTGVLLGQPVALGSFGGLRIAIGAGDLIDGPRDGGLPRIFAALQEATAPSRCLDGR